MGLAGILLDEAPQFGCQLSFCTLWEHIQVSFSFLLNVGIWPLAVIGNFRPKADLRAMHVQLVFRLLESANPF